MSLDIRSAYEMKLKDKGIYLDNIKKLSDKIRTDIKTELDKAFENNYDSKEINLRYCDLKEKELELLNYYYLGSIKNEVIEKGYKFRMYADYDIAYSHFKDKDKHFILFIDISWGDKFNYEIER